MVTQLKHLTADERDLMYRAPVLVSVLASCSYHEVNETRKRDALRLAHLKTFTADPLLIPYYREVEKGFAEQFDATVRNYYPFDDTKRAELQQEINRVSEVIAKLDGWYGRLLQNSLQRYVNHVKRSSHSVFEDFLLPIPIPGLSY